MRQSQKYTIVISGGGSGIGAALAEALSAEGHLLTICGRRKSRLQKIAKNNKNISLFQCDVSSEEEVLEFKRFVSEHYDHVDVLINCAGLFGAIGRFDQTDSELWKKTIDINLFGTYLLSKHFLPLILKSEGKRIINFSGGGAFSTFPNYSAYAVSKAAVVRFSENIADELDELGVRVNCVAPGFVATEIHEATLDVGEDTAGVDHFQLTKERFKEGSTPIRVPVECVKFLISPDADGLTGKAISASFDKWDTEEFRVAIREISRSELYTMRRINLVNLDENDVLREKLSSL
jgi:3-oxoacyl-[acyl-carrier protein] reductase